jgi:CheY-like chemotaxis protein
VEVDLAGLRALVVEDNPINQQLAAELLASKGVAVEVAGNGQEAIERITARAPDYYGVVLMDLQMPVLDGYEATRQLRLDPRYLDLPIVAMTAHAMADERERCLVLGMNGHISKPIDPDVLYATLAGLRTRKGVARPGPTTPGAAGTAAAIGPPRTELPAIDGLDTEAGLRHAAGNAALYAQLLRRFAQDYAGFGPEVEAMLSSSRRDEAARQAHTLKGLSGSLGAKDVRPCAADLEIAVRGGDIADARAALQKTVASLAPLVAAIRARFGEDDGGAATSGSPGAVESGPGAGGASAGLPWMRRLRSLLEEGDVEARDLWASKSREAAAILPADLRERISRALEAFEYDTALRLLPAEPEPPDPR